MALHSENDDEIDVRREDRVALRVFAARLQEAVERAAGGLSAAPLGEVDLDVHVGQPNRVTIRGADDQELGRLVRDALSALGARIEPATHAGHGVPPTRVTVALVPCEGDSGWRVAVDHPAWEPGPEELAERSLAVAQELARQRRRDALRRG